MIYEKIITSKGNRDRYRLRPFNQGDMGERYFHWFHDPLVTQHNSHGLFPYGRERMQEFIRELENPTSRIVWAIEAYIAEDDQLMLIGNCALQGINLFNRSAEFAIVIGEPAFWGKGVATFALESLINHAFRKMGLHRVWTGTAAVNIGMQRVCEKAGMTKEGVFRDGMFLNGKFEDIIAYGILNKGSII